jgi:hypothetical protein
VYNGLYPDEVAGAVLIHATDADVFEHEPEYMKGGLSSVPRSMQSVVQSAGCNVFRPVAVHLGLLRLLGNPGAGRPFGLANLPPPQRQELIFLSNNPTTAETEGEGCLLNESMAELRAAGNFGNRPLYVLAGSTPFQSPEPRYEKATEELNDYWFHQLQPRLAALSTRGHLVLEENAERADSVVDAVRKVVSESRLQ